MDAERETTGAQWFTSLADSLPVLVWCSGPDGRCTYFNRRWLDFTGRSLQDSVGEGWVEDVHHEDRERVADAYYRHLKARQEFRLEYRLRSKEGIYQWIVDFGSPVLDGNQAFRGYVGGCIDVTLTKGTAVARGWREKYDDVFHASGAQVIDKLAIAEAAIRDALSEASLDQIEREELTQALAKLLATKGALWRSGSSREQ